MGGLCSKSDTNEDSTKKENTADEVLITQELDEVSIEHQDTSNEENPRGTEDHQETKPIDSEAKKRASQYEKNDENVLNAERAPLVKEVEKDILHTVASLGCVENVVKMSQEKSLQIQREAELEQNVLSGARKISQQEAEDNLLRAARKAESRRSVKVKQTAETLVATASGGYMEVETVTKGKPESTSAAAEALRKAKCDKVVGIPATEVKKYESSVKNNQKPLSPEEIKAINSVAAQREAQETDFEMAMRLRLQAEKEKREEEKLALEAEKVAAEAAQKLELERKVAEEQRKAEATAAAQEVAAQEAAIAKAAAEEAKKQAALERQAAMSVDTATPWLNGAKQ